MSAITQYLDDLKTKLLLSPIIAAYRIIAEREQNDRGYFRARLTLMNGDFLEVSEYFVLQQGRCIPLEYRHQWMNASQQQLIKRWDNAKHFPNLPNFPHHIHENNETHAIPGTPLNIIELITLIEAEFCSRTDDKENNEEQ